MAFARIDYFGDAGGSSGWSGTVSSLRELDRFDWGDGRKSPTGRFGDGGVSARDVQQIVKRAIKDSERLERSGSSRDFVRRINAADKVSRGVTVSVKDGFDTNPGDESMIVPGARRSSTFPMASRIAYDKQSNSMALFVRNVDISGLGRVTAVWPEERVNIQSGGSVIGNEEDSEKISGEIEIRSEEDSNVIVKTEIVEEGGEEKPVLKIGVYYI